jgi:glycosyltransferase involved in cell wall biosynthesis
MLRGADIQLFHSVDAAVLPREPGCPIISTSHDVIPLVLPERRGPLDGWHRARKRARLGRSYRRAALIVADSETTRRDIVRELAIPESRISVVHLGVDSSHFTPREEAGEGARLRRELGLPERWFLCVSSDHRRKNHRRLFEAWHLVSDRVPEGLVFVGKAMYEQTLQELRGEAERRGMLSRFRWLDGIGDARLPALYRQATATIAPSLYEGFGMTLLEAMACGSPVAAAANGAYEEVAGDAALFFAPREPAAIEQALLRLSGEPALRSQLGERGLQRARAWSWERTARNTLALYRRVLQGEGGQGGR